MLSKLMPTFRLALPLSLLASPLLLAAARPIDSEPYQFPCNVPAAEGSQSASFREDPSRYMGKREAEAANSAEASEPAFLTNRWAMALRLLLSNRYAQEDSSTVGISNTPATAPTENNCLAQNSAIAPQVIPPSDPLIAQLPAQNNSPFTLAQEPDLLPDLSFPSRPAPLPSTTPAPTPTPTPPVRRPQPRPAQTTPPQTTPPPISPAPLPARPLPSTPPPRALPPNPSAPLPPSSSIDPTNITPTRVNPTPFDGSVIQTLAARPDGNYRYLSGDVENRAYTDAELQQRGSIFVLKKEGNRVTGNLSPRLGLPGICVTGVVSGDTVSGSAYPQAAVDSPSESDRTLSGNFQPYGSGALQVRNPRTASIGTDEASRSGLYYASAVLDLSDFSMINAGSSLPPQSCRITHTNTEQG